MEFTDSSVWLIGIVSLTLLIAGILILRYIFSGWSKYWKWLE